MLTVKNIVKGIALAGLFSLTTGLPAHAILEGSNRDRFEYLDFSENMIRDSLYAKSGRAVFNQDQNRFVRGIKESNAPRIYEPDVYTWELAMAEHRKRLAQLAPPQQPPIPMVSPVPMSGPGMLPANPMPLQLTPIGPQAVYESTGMLPADAQERMNDMVYRARARGLHSGSELRANEIKQRLVDHMNSMGGGQGSSAQYGSPAIPALLPALPDLPKGSRGDSYDSGF
ncbi:MAG: hypothetical protein A2W80_12600 [Candidatus Riflebacteria bacterium GWC2_50_8]|nr:MAG: hypothetical protein A2W80_12600 [Candidatus Riflebacteria bacterium GWC2_50_8]